MSIIKTVTVGELEENCYLVQVNPGGRLFIIDPGAEEQFYATLEVLRRRMTVLTVSHDLGFVNREVDLVICVNRRVTVHEAGRFDAAAANAVYHHEVNLIKHDHDCFCNCKHADCGRKEGR